MYSTCIFCHSALGANEAIEHFPVGRRLAFDAARGRLWVVCRKCERWNLTPLEERWEAIEECERAFRDTRLRVSTDNIGLARLREGVELVRIGSPQRPEMAAWRYGDQFGRRRTRHLTYMGVGAAAVAGWIALGPVMRIATIGGFPAWQLVTYANTYYTSRRVRARLTLPGYGRVVVRGPQLRKVTLFRELYDWGMTIPVVVSKMEMEHAAGGRAPSRWRWDSTEETTVAVVGDEALQMASKLLPAINAAGASRAKVENAVELIGSVAEPTSLFMQYASAKKKKKSVWAYSDRGYSDFALEGLPADVRLALEMAVHENDERRALEGELSILETAWREAEEIAAISDDLVVPDGVRTKIDTLKARDD